MLRLVLVTDDLDVARAGKEASFVPAHHEIIDHLPKRPAVRSEAHVLLAQELESLVYNLRGDRP